MEEAQDFIVALTRAAKSWWEIKLLVKSVFGDKNLSSIRRNFIIKAFKDKKLIK
jgi:hypothetical protein